MMPFQDATLEISENPNGGYTCGTTTVYFEGPPKANYSVNTNEFPSPVDGLPLPGDKPFSTGTCTISGKYRIATLTFSSLKVTEWHDIHFDGGFKVTQRMKFVGPFSDELLTICLRCRTHAGLFRKALWFFEDLWKKFHQSMSSGHEAEEQPQKSEQDVDAA
jgi:hypothetical protein